MNKYQSYIYDLGLNVKILALEAKRKRDLTARDTVEREYLFGRLMALAEVISMLQDTAIGLGIELHEGRLDDIDTDRDLI